MDFYDLAAILTLIIVPILGILMIFSPFFIVAKILKKRKKQFTVKIVLLCFLLSGIVAIALILLWMLFWSWAFDQIGDALLRSF